MNIAGYLNYSTKLDTSGLQKGMGTVKSIVAGIGITKIIGKAVDVLSSSLDGAISRVDTLNNYPKVMKSLGYSTQQATKSVNKLSDGIEGLPTSLDEIVNNAQMLTASLDDLDKGTESAIALNDMFLAGGQGADAASRALTQYNQILAKGKVDQQSWNTLVEVAPAQMKQLSQSLLGAGKNQKDLYEALQNGTLSIEDMNNAIIDLDKNGGKGFESFANQALSATGGIKTSITNLKTAVVKGVANMIQAINQRLEKAGLPTIQEFLGLLKGDINEFFNFINGLIEGKLNASDISKKIMEILKKALDFAKNNLPVIMGKITEFITKISEFVVNNIKPITDIVLQIIKVVAKTLTDNIAPITLALVDIIVAITDAAAEYTPVVMDMIAELISQIIVEFSKPEVLKKFYKVGLKLYEALVEGLLKQTGMLIALPFIIIYKLFKKFIEVIKNINFKQVGKNIIDGIKNGLHEKAEELYNSLQKIGEKSLAKLKSFFKIKSPSRLMRDEIGKYLPLGIADGIENNTNAIDKAIDNMNSDIYSKMKNAVNLQTGKLSANASLRSNADYNSIIQINNDLTSDVYLDKQKVGQAITPVVSRTLKTAGVR